MSVPAPLAARFSHVGIAARDPERLERFYAEILGFRRVKSFQAGGERIVMIRAEGLGLEIFPSSENRPAGAPQGVGPGYPCYRHLAFDVADLDEALLRLGPGVAITHGPLVMDAIEPGFRVVWVSDPEGNILEFSQRAVNPPQPKAVP
ncbi:MAG: VOC family protein [Fibrobacteria bacterium]|nr:VOC family protein [Fibrobacteria bacterium]